MDTKNFKDGEFACKHCGENKIDQRVMNMAQAIRDYVGVPVKVNSGYRCEKHNSAVGGVKGSYHTKGLAADLSCEKGGQVLYLAAQRLFAEGKLPDLAWCKYYIKKDFIHIDCGHKRTTRFAKGD